MNTIFNQARPYIQHLSLSENNVFIAGLKKHAKVTAIALAIIGAITASFYIFHWLQNSKRPTPPTPPVPIDKSPASPVINLHPSPPRKPVVTPKPPVRGQIKPFVFDPSPVRATPPKMADSFISTPPPARQTSQDSHSSASHIQSPVPQIVTSPATPPPQPIATSLPFAQIDEICEQVLNNIFSDPEFSAQEAYAAINPKNKQQIIDVYDELVHEYERRNPTLPRKIRLGDPVPAYFANTNGQMTDEQKKYLSLVGIRSMFRYGPKIMDDLKDQLFIGGEHHYEHDKGLVAFKTYTGNTVDLDTELDPKKFTSDAQAIRKARKLIVKFGKKCGLKPTKGDHLTPEDVAKQLPKRKLELPTHQVHDSKENNTDRSNFGVWKRIPPTKPQYHYYVNVPNCKIATLAILRLPYMIAEIAQLAKNHNGGIISKDFFDIFFKKISTGCFNHKLMKFEKFYLTWKGKFENPTPEEIAKRKIENGAFGEKLREIGAQKAIEGKKSRIDMGNILFDYYYDIYGDEETERGPMKGRSKDQWIAEEIDTCANFLMDEGMWESVLYQCAENYDYFPLDAIALKDIMGPFYDVMKGHYG
jgi:hypothetical protein